MGILGDLFLLVDPFIVANAAIDPLAVSISCTGSLSLYPAGFLSSAGLFLLPASDLPGFLSSPEPFLLLAFDLPGFLSSAGPLFLPVSVVPCFLGPSPFGFAGAFVDSAAIVLPALSLPSVELPSSTDVALFPVAFSS